MRYGYFDNDRREYVIDRVDVPASWTNYIGLKDFYGVFNHTAAGYVLYKSSEYHRITRFRPNGPMDGPGHYVYIRDNDTGDYWSVSWQPVGKPKEHYSCRHGLSYSKYLCDYSGINAQQTLFAAIEDPLGRAPAQRFRQKTEPLRIFLSGIQLPSGAHGQPELPDEPLCHRQPVRRRCH